MEIDDFKEKIKNKIGFENFEKFELNPIEEFEILNKIISNDNLDDNTMKYIQFYFYDMIECKITNFINEIKEVISNMISYKLLYENDTEFINTGISDFDQNYYKRKILFYVCNFDEIYTKYSITSDNNQLYNYFKSIISIDELYSESAKWLFGKKKAEKYLNKYPKPDYIDIDFIVDSSKLWDFIFKFKIKGSD